MSVQQKPIILVDGSSYLYRAFHALPLLTNSKGFPTGAIYGVVNMLKRLMADYNPEYLAVVFDSKGKTFRDELYPAYKATRKEMPNDLFKQIQPIYDIIHALGIPILIIEGVEADDIIGTLATQASQRGLTMLISTGDKDLAQLVNEHITLVNTMSNTVLNPETVKQKFGVMSQQIVDYLTLVGDTSDNISGVPQVGPKTAAKWLNQYGSLDNLVQQAEKITGKVGESFRASLAQLPLIKSLVTIKTDIDLLLNLEELKLKTPDHQKLIEFFKELEFKTWLSELLEKNKEAHVDKFVNYEIIFDEDKLKKWLAKLSQTNYFAINTETTHLDSIQANLVGISFAIEKGFAAYIPLAHDYDSAPQQLATNIVFSLIKPLLENSAIKKIGLNLKYDIEVFARYDIKLKGVCFDCMLESYVLDSVSNSHDLNSLALKYLGYRPISYEEIAGKGAQQLSFNQVEIEKAARYAAESADIALELHGVLWPRIAQEKGLQYIYEEIEAPLISVLATIEQNGVLINPQKLKKQGEELEKRLQQLQQEAFERAGQTFNLNSPKQLQEILFSKLNLPVLQKTGTGQASTADHVLQELALDFALPRIIIEYRRLSKLLSTYTSRLIEQINPNTGRVHTSYNQTGTATGRLSSSEPNLQNIPIRTIEGRQIRQAFIAEKGYKIVSADYSQIELRLMAHISQDEGLVDAFLQNLDIHTATAAEVADIPLDKVTPQMRRDAKAVNFGLIYGMSAFGLTRQLGIDRNAAQNYIQRYFSRYPGVKQYMDNTRTQAKEKGYVETLWGRRLYLPDIQASQMARQKAAERAAINAPLQGSAADIIKMAMIQIDHWLQEEEIAAKMIMQVHDELVFEVHEQDVDRLVTQIKKLMTEVVQLRVPLIVSVGIGNNWDEASEH